MGLMDYHWSRDLISASLNQLSWLQKSNCHADVISQFPVTDTVLHHIVKQRWSKFSEKIFALMLKLKHIFGHRCVIKDDNGNIRQAWKRRGKKIESSRRQRSSLIPKWFRAMVYARYELRVQNGQALVGNHHLTLTNRCILVTLTNFRNNSNQS